MVKVAPGLLEVVREHSNDYRTFQAGQLKKFYSKWEKMGAPEIVLKLIQGYRIPFFQKPPLIYPNLKKGPFHTPISPEMTKIVQILKQQKVLEVAQISPSYISPMFLVPKLDGSARPIFNLKTLNKYVIVEPFHLINMCRIPDFLQPQDWLCKVDLSQAYFHTPIVKSQRRFLRLVYNQELLEMTCLPFGLCTAPKTFSILTNWVAQLMRQNWHMRILVYLDDFLIVHQDAHTLRKHVKILVQTLSHLGWVVNLEKSFLYPQREIIYLGILWKPWDNQKCLPVEKINVIVSKINLLLKTKGVTLKDLQRILGLLNFASFVVPRGRLNHRQLMIFMNSIPKKSSKTYPLTLQIAKELIWWKQNCQLSTLLHYPPPKNFLVTDASDIAWGAQLNDLTFSGTWSREEKHLHCNQKEMLAILYALQSQASLIRQSSLLIQCDNQTAVAYLRREGGTRSFPLMKITYQILNLLDQLQIHFTIHYLPGKYNNQADHLSRHRVTPEWHLLPTCVNTVFAKWGTPVIDLFASKTAHVVYNYVTRDLRDQKAVFHDAFSVPWNYPLAWVFPPPFLIPKVLMHLNQATGTYLIVVPRWEKVFWRADLKARALAAPLTLKNLQNYLRDQSTGRPPQNVENIVLEVWKCGGGHQQ